MSNPRVDDRADARQAAPSAPADTESTFDLVERIKSGDREGLDRPAITGQADPASSLRNWAHLTLVERLGGGTFGEVYRAWDPLLEREVALKLLLCDDPGWNASRILHEGRLMARVHHPNVITVHGVAAEGARVGLWLELIRGATLEQALLKQGRFSAREAALIGIDLCRALAAIHAAGLIHRDVTPQNVMREDGGRIVLMDLGTGRAIDAGDRLASAGRGRHAALPRA